MNPPFTEEEALSLRNLVAKTSTPSDAEISSVTTRPVADIRQIIRRLQKPLIDASIGITDLTNTINACKLRNVRLPPRIEPPAVPVEQTIHSANSLAIPPKFRGKSMAKTPTTSTHPQFTSLPSRQPAGQQLTQLLSIPILPKYASSPPGISEHRSHAPPKIGSLAAVLYPHLEHAHVCRVLGSCLQNDTECFLVAFFQSEHSPCYVPGEYLFQLQSHVGFPFGDEEEFRKNMESGQMSVDWLLETIFSSAQNLVINSAEILFPPEQLSESKVKPSAQQVQQLMFQCVFCAALLVVCYVAGQWDIPEHKLGLILSTILKANTTRFETTRNAMSEVEVLLTNLLLKKE